MASKRKIEVEAKYRLKSPGGADRYLVAPEIGPFASDGHVQSVRVEDRYLDSVDWALAKAGYAARLRTTRQGTRINLKGLSNSGARLQRRVEVEGPADTSLDPASWPASKARVLVLEICGDAALVELLTIRQLRRIRPLRAGNTRAEMSVDEVEVVANGHVMDTFEELEVELKGGDEAPLAALADVLDRSSELEPISSSKLQRAMDSVRAALPTMPKEVQDRWRAVPDELLAVESRPEDEAVAAPEAQPVPTAGPEPCGDVPPEAGAETGARKPGIRAEDSMSEAALKVLRSNFARMKKREAGTRSGHDAEDLHDMRVAARRIRAAWRLFESAFKPAKTKKLRRRLESISDRLGAARDLDVLTQGLDAYGLTLDETQRRGLDPLRSVWRHQRDVARGALVRELDSGSYEAFVKEMSAFLDSGANSAAYSTTPMAPHRVRDRVPSEIWATYEAVRAYELVLPWADMETLHDLRIAAKWLRYALEFFGEALGPASGPLLERVAALQDHLGCLHDADVAARLARDVLVAKAGELSKTERDAIGAYLRAREREVTRRRRSLGPVWRAVNGASFRQALGRATAAL